MQFKGKHMNPQQYHELKKQTHKIIYTHCATCFRDLPAQTAPKDWLKLEAIIDCETGTVVIGCQRCNLPIIVTHLYQKTYDMIKDCGCSECKKEG
jgi:hypothetical protein